MSADDLADTVEAFNAAALPMRVQLAPEAVAWLESWSVSWEGGPQDRAPSITEKLHLLIAFMKLDVDRAGARFAAEKTAPVYDPFGNDEGPK